MRNLLWMGLLVVGLMAGCLAKVPRACSDEAGCLISGPSSVCVQGDCSEVFCVESPDECPKGFLCDTALSGLCKRPKCATPKDCPSQGGSWQCLQLQSEDSQRYCVLLNSQKGN